MRISQRGLNMIEHYEEYVAHPYWDPYGRVWTRGYGETGGDITGSSPSISQAQAEANLIGKLSRQYEPAIEAVGVPLNQNQWDALCDFVWNIGPGGVGEGFDVGRSLRAHQYGLAANQLLEYDRSGGVTLPGLVERRQEERLLFLTPVKVNPLEVLFPNEHALVVRLKLALTHPTIHAVEIGELKHKLTLIRKNIWRAAVKGIGPDGKPTMKGWNVADREARYKLLKDLTE